MDQIGICWFQLLLPLNCMAQVLTKTYQIEDELSTWFAPCNDIYGWAQLESSTSTRTQREKQREVISNDATCNLQLTRDMMRLRGTLKILIATTYLIHTASNHLKSVAMGSRLTTITINFLMKCNNKYPPKIRPPQITKTKGQKKKIRSETNIPCRG